MDTQTLTTAAAAIAAALAGVITALTSLVVWVVHRLFKNADRDRQILVKALKAGLKIGREAKESSQRIEAILSNGICRADCSNYIPLHPPKDQK